MRVLAQAANAHPSIRSVFGRKTNLLIYHYEFSISMTPPCTTIANINLHNTPRFNGAHHHHYLLDFLQSVAERYRDDDRAGDLVVDLLKLNVPKLFAVEGGSKEDEAVRCEFSCFLRDYMYIFECDFQPTIFEKIMVREPNHQVLCKWTLLPNDNVTLLPSLRMQSQTSMMSSSSWF